MRWMWFCSVFAVAAGCGHPGTRQGSATLELYPAEESESRDWRCRDYDGRCVLLAARPVLKLDAPRFRVVAGDKPAISIDLPAAQQRELARVTGGTSRSLAVVVDGQVLHVAKLRGPLTGGGLMLSFCNRANFARVMQALHPAS